MKSYYKFFLSISLLLVIINNALSQDAPNPFDQNVISQTPKKSQFPVIMGNFSVNHFTGQPNIEVPIYNVDAHDIQVPIALKYRTGGLKVEVEDGYLGRYWDLIVGGEIRRTVIGLPDDINTSAVKGYRYIDQPIIGYSNNNRRQFVNLLKNYDLNFDPLAVNCDILKQSGIYGPQYSDGRFDTSPDIFNFNVNGISGTFTTGTTSFIDNLQCNEWVSISNDTNGDYKITDSKGYIYIFGEKEYHKYKYRTGYFGSFIEWKKLPIYKFDYVLSWKLSKIISPTGEYVLFHYNSHNKVDKTIERPLYSSQSSYTCHYYPQVCRSESAKTIKTLQDPYFSDDPAECKEEYIYKYLTQIEAKNTLVEFGYKFLDNNFPKLNTIEVSVGNGEKNRLKKIEINNSSYYANINSIKEYGNSNEYKETKFYYYSMPSFEPFGKEKDHWGYYSPGAKEYVSGLYDFHYPHLPNEIWFYEEPYYFGQRNPKLDNANSGMLHQILYPTGGIVSFDWESHDYSLKSELLKNEYMTDGYFNGSEVTIQPEYKVTKKELNQNNTLSDIYIYNNYKTVTIDLEKYYPSDGYNINDLPCDENSVSFCKCVLDWINNGINYPNDIPYIKITGPNNFEKTIMINKINVWKKHNVLLGNQGNYRFELINAGKELIKDQIYCYEFYTYIMAPGGEYGKVGISIEELIEPDEYKNKRDNTYFAGGVRIKDITFDDGRKKVKKLYNYSLNPYDKKSPSSGVITTAPRYGSISLTAREIPVCSDIIEGSSLFIENYTLSTNALPRSTGSLGHIEYSYVTEFTTNDPDGEIINNTLDASKSTQVSMYKFYTSADGLDYSDLNYTKNIEYIPNNQLILTSKDFNRGYLKEKKEFAEEEKTTQYQYSILENNNTDLISGTLFTIRDYSSVNSCYDMSVRCNDLTMSNYCWHKDFGIVRYKIIPYNKRISEINETGMVPNQKKYNYAYQDYSPERLANSPISEETVNSKGEKIINYYTYTDKNKIHTCITACNGKITAAYRYEYDSYGNPIQKYIAEISPESNLNVSNYAVGTLTITASHPIIGLTNKCIETRQYENNRLCQITNNETNISVVYVWGYNGEYPIAEIKNFTLNQLHSLLGNNINTLFYSENPEDISIIDNLRTQLPESMFTTFTYKMKVGITSIKDPRGIITYYDYDGFGQLKECYTKENDQKKIIQKMEYHLTY